VALGRGAHPSAIIFDSRTLQSNPESGPCAGSDGAKSQRGSNGHIAIDTLGHLLVLHVTPSNEQDRVQVAQLAEQEQNVTDTSVEVASVGQGDTDARARQDAAD
jgi:hypothetical protein